MPAKKAAKKAGGAKKAKAAPAQASEPVVLPVEPPVAWVTLSVRLVTWGYLDSTMRMPLTARVFDVRERIVARHGGSVSAGEVQIYTTGGGKRTEVSDLMLSLGELGLRADAPAGGSDGEEAVADGVVLLYDFKPQGSECPLLLSEPPSYRYAAEARRAAAVEAERRAKEEVRMARRSEAR